MSADKTELVAEIVEAMRKLGADVELLSIIGSIGDTLDNTEALELLRIYNGKGTMFRRVVTRREH